MGERIDTVINPRGADMGKFGHVELAVTEDELKSVFDFGDVLRVTIAGVGSFVMPFFHYYDEVGIGELVLCTYTRCSSAVVARNYRSFGVEIGLLEADGECSNFRMKDSYMRPLLVTIELERKVKRPTAFGFSGQRGVQMRGHDFRMVGGGLIREGAFFRSSSPVDARLTDSGAVDRKAKEAGVRSVLNLADTRVEAEGFPGFQATYCSRCKTVYLNMPLDVTSVKFQKSICAGFEFIAQSEPPFLAFCSEGRDRTGLFVALLQCICGASLGDIISDYVFSFQMLGGEGNAELLRGIGDSLKSNLCSILGVERLGEESLKSDTEKFLLSIGLSERTIAAVRNKIGAGKL